MSVNTIHARSILKQVEHISPDTWAEYFLDAYVAKESLVFEHSRHALGVRENAVRLLSKRLASKDKPRQNMIAIGYFHEPYPEAESRYHLSRGMIETLHSYAFPLYLQSASFRLLDDIKLLQSFSEHSELHVCIPMSLFDSRYSRVYDLDYSEGFELLRELKQALPLAHISVKILDIYPGLDDEVVLEKTFRLLSSLKPDSLCFSMKEDFSLKQTQNFLDAFLDDEDFVLLLDKKYKLKREDDGLVTEALSLSESQKEVLSEKIEKQMGKYKISNTVSRFLPLDYRYSNYEIAQRLFVRAKACVDSVEKEEITSVAQSIQSLNHAVNKNELLAYGKSPKVKRDIDYFLSTHELKNYGQGGLFS